MNEYVANKTARFRDLAVIGPVSALGAKADVGDTAFPNMVLTSWCRKMGFPFDISKASHLFAAAVAAVNACLMVEETKGHWIAKLFSFFYNPAPSCDMVKTRWPMTQKT